MTAKATPWARSRGKAGSGAYTSRQEFNSCTSTAPAAAMDRESAGPGSVIFSSVAGSAAAAAAGKKTVKIIKANK
jgi:hypothetical protein